MNQTGKNENRFVREVRSAAHGNPNVDMDWVREWQEITEMLDSLPPDPLAVFSR